MAPLSPLAHKTAGAASPVSPVSCVSPGSPASLSATVEIAGGASSTATAVGNAAEQRLLESLDKLELGCALTKMGFGDFKDEFIAAGVTGEMLQYM